MKSELRTRSCYGYLITGNKYVAIAVNLEDESDSHCFTIDPEVNNDAFVRACGWAYPGPNENEKRFQCPPQYGCGHYFDAIPDAENNVTCGECGSSFSAVMFPPLTPA